MHNRIICPRRVLVFLGNSAVSKRVPWCTIPLVKHREEDCGVMKPSTTWCRFTSESRGSKFGRDQVTRGGDMRLTWFVETLVQFTQEISETPQVMPIIFFYSSLLCFEKIPVSRPCSKGAFFPPANSISQCLLTHVAVGNHLAYGNNQCFYTYYLI